MKKLFSLLVFSTSALCANIFFTPEMIQTHLKEYTPEERELIEQDLKAIREICVAHVPASTKPTYLSTAGAPGARKTTILERFVKAHPELGPNVYVDPDQRALKFMANTYYARSL